MFKRTSTPDTIPLEPARPTSTTSTTPQAAPWPSAVPDLAGEMSRSRDAVTTWCWEYPFELPLGEETLTCAACGARRDWLLILHRETVSVRCRCTHQWMEPRIPADWYREETGPAIEIHPSAEHALRATGFDGTFAGTYW